MKKLFIVLSVFSISVFACKNKDHNNSKDVKPYRQVGVPNVNGNIPDTSNAIDLSTKKSDSFPNKSDSSSH